MNPFTLLEIKRELMMSKYDNGAITALSYMAEQGASQKAIKEVADIMSLTFDNIDESDKERFEASFGGFESDKANNRQEQMDKNVAEVLLGVGNS